MTGKLVQNATSAMDRTKTRGEKSGGGDVKRPPAINAASVNRARLTRRKGGDRRIRFSNQHVASIVARMGGDAKALACHGEARSAEAISSAWAQAIASPPSAARNDESDVLTACAWGCASWSACESAFLCAWAWARPCQESWWPRPRSVCELGWPRP